MRKPNFLQEQLKSVGEFVLDICFCDLMVIVMYIPKVNKLKLKLAMPKSMFLYF